MTSTYSTSTLARANSPAASTPTRRLLNILIPSEFSYPDYGGIETHIMQLSKCLVSKGHKVVLVTREFGNRRGIRFLSSGIKVYHIPSKSLIKPCGLPYFVDRFPLIRNILIREQIDIIHWHQSSSRMGQEYGLVGSLMGYKTVMSDHSLFGFCDLGPTLLTEYLRLSLEFSDHIVCMSNVHKENLVLRAQIDPRKVSIIGNALEHNRFYVDTSRRPRDRIIIVALCRLTKRKGVDLLIQVIPKAVALYDKVDFIIGGDGPMFSYLVEMIDEHYLHHRVTLLGSVQPVNVPKLLQRGHIFINCSTTESFCIAILEAAACGLLVVATHVGGVPEILPSDMLHTTDCNVEGVLCGIIAAIEQLPNVNPHEMHARVVSMYSWERVADKVEQVYFNVIKQPPKRYIDHLSRAWSHKSIFSRLHNLVVTFLYTLWHWFAHYKPASEIDLAPRWCG
ncbi:bifunctional PIGA [Babesia duncani]|uniref:Bifunctional PIGA n=1 Tax=Babesia duncani TaxID=323732 RepID=A0AAD9PKA0_9APIC|nr:bifunctional PIGA [Babesia duncani]